MTRDELLSQIIETSQHLTESIKKSQKERENLNTLIDEALGLYDESLREVARQFKETTTTETTKDRLFYEARILLIEKVDFFEKKFMVCTIYFLPSMIVFGC